MSNSFTHHPSSFRDPSGFIFEKDGVVYRQVNKSFSEHFDFFEGNCYEKLVQKGLLIPHRVVRENLTSDPQWYRTLEPERIEFISYPYEWSFDLLKDAALLTLQLLKESINCGMILKDASPYNIQWHRGRLIFIDSLSFEKYDETQPWIAYRQFCESFLAPLLLMHHSKNALAPFILAYPDGIPLGIASSLLPWRSKLSLHTYLHIHLHAAISKKSRAPRPVKAKFSKHKLLNLVTSLETLIRGLKSPAQSTAWSAYYIEASQRNDYLDQKKKIISEWLDKLVSVKTAADLGANNGEFSRLLAARNIRTIAADFDPYCINSLYREIRENKEQNLQPLIIDLSNPSPAIGVNNEERASFIERTNVDLSLALALVHHLAIGKNISLSMIANFFRQLCKNLIVEFVPKTDEKVQLMLAEKKDIYTSYDESHFEQAFQQHFSIINKQPVPGSERILYLMKRTDE